jgi:hypothetical protein
MGTPKFKTSLPVKICFAEGMDFAAVVLQGPAIFLLSTTLISYYENGSSKNKEEDISVISQTHSWQ